MVLHDIAYSLLCPSSCIQDGQTPFLLACEAGHADTVTFLLTCDRNIVNTKDSVSVLSVLLVVCNVNLQ